MYQINRPASLTPIGQDDWSFNNEAAKAKGRQFKNIVFSVINLVTCSDNQLNALVIVVDKNCFPSDHRSTNSSCI